MKYLFNFLAGILVMTIFLLIFQKIYLDKKDSLTKTTKNKIVNTPTVKPTEIIIPTAAITRGPTTPPIVGKIFSIRPNNDLTIQEAVDLAQPGDTVVLSPGEYFQDVVTKKDGLPDKPITIKGQKSSIVKGAGNSRVFQVNHSYITLEGFTIDGHFKNSKEISSYRDKLLYVTGKIAGKALVNLKVFNMDIKNAGGECVRLRYLVQNSEIAYNSIFTCGVGDFEYNDGGKNGEGIYIGTAPEQLKDGKNPTSEVDRSNNNYIHNNYIDTQGNECVDIKEGSSFNIVEYNKCTGQRDPNSGGLDSRGNDNIFRYNEIYDNLGAGVRLGGDEDKDGTNNQVYGNRILNNKSGGIKFQRTPQGRICGNEMERNEKGSSVGSYGEDYNPEKSC
ncbi:MAG: right-handed parallel beta-helix repeat-containing protein [Patescibacteria group bacterium]